MFLKCGNIWGLFKFLEILLIFFRLRFGIEFLGMIFWIVVDKGRLGFIGDVGEFCGNMFGGIRFWILLWLFVVLNFWDGDLGRLEWICERILLLRI